MFSQLPALANTVRLVMQKTLNRGRPLSRIPCLGFHRSPKLSILANRSKVRLNYRRVMRHEETKLLFSHPVGNLNSFSASSYYPRELFKSDF